VTRCRRPCTVPAGMAGDPCRRTRAAPINRMFNCICYVRDGWQGAGSIRYGVQSFQPVMRRRHAPYHAGRALNGVKTMAVDLSMPILVVDDYNTMIRIIRNLLKQLGFEDIDDASDGSAALTKLREKKYGLVISDWNMEPMTGYELLKEVRSDPSLNKTPFIMVTAESKTENVIAAKKAGVNNYIVKPFNAQTLKTKIE